HGHADELVQLLRTLGYERAGGVYGHTDRRLIFLGDFIDRGPQIRRVLEIVRPMVEAGHALAVMGNHELNALAYHTEDRDLRGELGKAESQPGYDSRYLHTGILKRYVRTDNASVRRECACAVTALPS